MNVDIIFRFATSEAFFTAMDELEVPNFPENEKPEEQLGAVSTHPLVTHQGIVRMVRMVTEYLANIPDVILSPETVLIDWRSDEVYEDDYFPTYTIDAIDAEGNLYIATVELGRISS